jgi:hypothetical protein
VLVSGKEDKRGMTACVTCTFDGVMLPPQLVYKEKTARALPKGAGLEAAQKLGFDLTQSPNHWSTQETMEEWVDNVSSLFTCS